MTDMGVHFLPRLKRRAIEGALDLLTPQAQNRGLELALLIHPRVPPTILGDATRLRQILINLIGNAVKFTATGEVAVEVKLQPASPTRLASTGARRQPPEAASPKANDCLLFSVRDTGVGIPPDRLDRLFKSFSQIDTSTTRKYGGTGLGLAISKRLAEMMDGTMWATSEGVPGQGSLFYFTSCAEAAPPLPNRAYLHAAAPPLVGKRLLIVDDNATNRQFLTLQTQAWDMDPVAVASAAEALVLIEAGEPFDLGLLDMQMPGQDGVELATEIRRWREARILPLVLLSSVGDLDLAGTEFAAVLTKPIKASPLYNVLSGIFAGLTPALKLKPAEPPATLFDAELAHKFPQRLLLAEDNVTNQKLALRLLERLGYRADVAANGLEVLQALRRQAYDVVFMDMQMPEMDGLEATRLIRRDWERQRRPRIIAMTANAMKEDREACLAAGMDDYLSKPIRLEELVRVLAQRQGPAESGQGPEADTAPGIECEPPAAESLDLAVLETFRKTMGGGDAFLAELLDVFQADAPELLTDMTHAVAWGDPAGLRQAAHSLKSNSASFGATRLAALCQEAERLGKAETLEGAAAKVAQIGAEYEKVLAALDWTLPIFKLHSRQPPSDFQTG